MRTASAACEAVFNHIRPAHSAIFISNSNPTQYEDYKRDLRLRLRAMADTETAAPGQPELLFV